MRAIFSIVGLAVVAYIVLKLSGTQLHALTPAAADASGSAGATAAQLQADKVTRAIEQGAAQRAADAASR